MLASAEDELICELFVEVELLDKEELDELVLEIELLETELTSDLAGLNSLKLSGA
ncbi:MAG: hypothetical protein WCK98_00600 [bacterium]